MDKNITAEDFGLPEYENTDPEVNYSIDTIIDVSPIKNIGWCTRETIGISIINPRVCNVLTTFGKYNDKKS